MAPKRDGERARPGAQHSTATSPSTDNAQGSLADGFGFALEVDERASAQAPRVNGGQSHPPAARQIAPSQPMHAEHRKRMRARLLQGGSEAFHDYELLEMLLFGANARGDTKPTAKRLMAEFGSLAGVLNAEPARLKQVKGVGDAAVAVIKLADAVGVRVGRLAIVDQTIFNSWQVVLEYLQRAMAHRPREELRILFLDKRNALISDEVQQRGTVDHTPVYVREIARRALEVGATAIILAHNHPSGDPTPSRADVDMTNQIVNALKPLEIVIHDHLIVGREGHFSFRSNGLL